MIESNTHVEYRGECWWCKASDGKTATITRAGEVINTSVKNLKRWVSYDNRAPEAQPELSFDQANFHWRNFTS